jgi:hypothetical protein
MPLEGQTMTIEIDKNVPAPTQHYRTLKKYPWPTMEVGDSFLFPSTTSADTAYTVARAQSRDGKKFIVRTTDDGRRCWRVA